MHHFGEQTPVETVTARTGGDIDARMAEGAACLVRYLDVAIRGTVIADLVTRDDKPRLGKRCALPLTGGAASRGFDPALPCPALP